jgi:SMODS and SLOG-associating 2TM effector domain 1
MLSIRTREVHGRPQESEGACGRRYSVLPLTRTGRHWRPAPGDYTSNGRIPFTLRIGVTGHRLLTQPDALVVLIQEALRRLAEDLCGARYEAVALVAVSALAEGADRLVAEQVLEEPNARLEAVLPMPVREYLRDFEAAASKRRFKTLLAEARETWRAPKVASREEAYELASRHVVDVSDAVIALWDGQPGRGRGGTAETVAYARARGVPIAWIRTDENPVLFLQLHRTQRQLIRQGADQLREYNTSAISREVIQSRVKAQYDRLMHALDVDQASGALRASVESAANWLLPHFVRADFLAVRLQRRFRVLSSAMFMMAAVSVAIVAVQDNFLPTENWLVIFEVALLSCLVAIPLLNRRWHLHDRWISYRFLAERFRSAYFLALAGTGDRRQRPATLTFIADASESWIERALAEVTSRRPQLELADIQGTRRFLSRHWLENQVSYHSKLAKRHHRAEERIFRATGALFAVTMIAAILHMLRIGDSAGHASNWPLLFVVLSISIPALGAALHGIGAQRQYRRHADRCHRMSMLLGQLRVELDGANDIRTIQELAAETERIMREENNDWFGAMRFYDMELIT